MTGFVAIDTCGDGDEYLPLDENSNARMVSEILNVRDEVWHLVSYLSKVILAGLIRLWGSEEFLAYAEHLRCYVTVQIDGEIGAALSVIEPVYCGSSLKRMEQEGPPITQQAFPKETW